MFNQSISKFSSSKLSIAISTAILGLIFSSFAEAEPLVINDKEYDILDKELTTPKGYGLYINAVSNIVGNSLIIGMDPGYNGPVRGVYNKADSSLSIKSVDINLNSARDLMGIYVYKNKKLDIKNSSLGIDLSSNGGANQVLALMTAGGASLILSDTDLTAVMNRENSETITRPSVGISNAGNLIFDGKNNSLRIVTNINGGSKVESTIFNIDNASAGNMRIDAKEIYLGINLGEEVSGKGPSDTRIAALRSSGEQLFLGGEKLSINIKDEGQGALDRQLYGILVQDGMASLSTETLEISGHAAGGYIYGVSSQSAADADANVNLKSNTKISLSSAQRGNSYGLFAMEGGKLTVDGNLEVHAEKAVAIRGANSQININPNGDKVVKLYGDIDFNLYSPENNVTEPTVDILLSGTESVWDGHATITAAKKADESPEQLRKRTEELAENELKLNVHLKDGAKWSPNNTNEGAAGNIHTAVKALDNLTMDNAVIELTEKSGPNVVVTNLKGTGGEVHTQVAIGENSIITSNKLSIKKN